MELETQEQCVLCVLCVVYFALSCVVCAVLCGALSCVFCAALCSLRCLVSCAVLCGELSWLLSAEVSDALHVTACAGGCAISDLGSRTVLTCVRECSRVFTCVHVCPRVSACCGRGGSRAVSRGRGRGCACACAPLAASTGVARSAVRGFCTPETASSRDCAKTLRKRPESCVVGGARRGARGGGKRARGRKNRALEEEVGMGMREGEGRLAKQAGGYFMRKH